MRTSYTGLQKILHWTIALLVIGMLLGGETVTDFDNRPWIEETFGTGAFNRFYDMHKSIGLLILFLMLIRIVVRFTVGKPAYAQPLPPAQHFASEAVHWAFYGLLILMPLVGWLGVMTFPAPAPFFGLFNMPAVLGPDRALSGTLLDAHEIMSKIIFALAIVHIAAALFHGFVKKDGVLTRMLR